MSAFKAQAHMRELKQRLQLSLAGATFQDNLDGDGYPELQMTVGSEVQFVKIKTVDNAGRVDGLGLPQESYAPHKCMILRDGDTISSVEARERLVAACTKLGMKLEVWQINTLPSSFDLTGATKLYEVASDEIHSLTKSQ